MTDAKQKPREWRLRQGLISFPENVDVIEKQAYDKLLVRIARTKSAAYYALLEMSAWLGVPEHERMKQINFLMENVNYCADVDIKDDEAKNE